MGDSKPYLFLRTSIYVEMKTEESLFSARKMKTEESLLSARVINVIDDQFNVSVILLDTSEKRKFMIISNWSNFTSGCNCDHSLGTILGKINPTENSNLIKTFGYKCGLIGYGFHFDPKFIQAPPNRKFI